MKTEKPKKLALERTTVRNLTPDQLDKVVGGEGPEEAHYLLRLPTR